MLKQLIRLSFKKLFENKVFRKKAIFQLKQYFYPELGFKIEIGNGLCCPIVDPSASYSFTEIFFDNEYKSVFKEISLPNTWLDLGSHYGFFSLYVASLKKKDLGPSNFKALLVDADSRVSEGVQKLIRLNRLESHFTFTHGAIASGSGTVSFAEQEVMSSSLANITVNPIHNCRKVPIIDQSSILNLLSPPYDLVKIDVEGGEYDFFVSYERVLEETKHLVVEWHSWHSGGGGCQQIHELAEMYGFRLIKVIQNPKLCDVSNPKNLVGVLLFSKQ